MTASTCEEKKRISDVLGVKVNLLLGVVQHGRCEPNIGRLEDEYAHNC